MGLELARCGGNVVEMGAGITAIGEICGMVSGFFEIFLGGHGAARPQAGRINRKERIERMERDRGGIFCSLRSLRSLRLKMGWASGCF